MPKAQAKELRKVPEDLIMNTCLVGANGYQEVSFFNPRRAMTRFEALQFAAWLVAVAEILPGDYTFEEILAAVRST